MTAFDDLKNQLKTAAELLRLQGVTGKLYVVPAAHDLRCFVPCNAGHCICSNIIEGKWVVVDETGRNKALDHANRTLIMLSEMIDKV
jgi:hypothetical protein